MVGTIRALWWILGLRLKSRERIEAENLALRHQLNVVCRSRVVKKLKRVELLRFVNLCLVKTWSSRLAARWSRIDAGDLVLDSSGDPWSAPEIVRQHVK